MATSLATTLTFRIKTAYTNALDLTSTADNMDLNWDDTLANGTAADQADYVWHDRGSAAAAPVDIDVAGGVTNAFGVALTYATVKGIMIKNRSTVSGEYLVVGGDANPLINWVSNGTDMVRIGPNGLFMLWNPTNSYAVTGGTGDVLQIDPAANTIAYDIVIIGTSA